MRKSRVNGFTMIEMMVTSTLGLLLIATIMSLLSLGRSVWQDTDAKLMTTQEVRKGLTTLSLDLPASSWTSPQSITIGGGGTSITFQIPQSINGNVVTWGDTIRYRLSGTQLLREDLTTNQTRVAANLINSATFTSVGTPPNAYITAAIVSQNTSLSTRTFRSSLQTNFSVRN